ncbi:ethanolamine ammonia-lyase light chain EutC [Nocardia sp. NPDC049149]|uniref:ethanolamine ammonia-lyase light chain EutC n=1 Tax=Nocardia sp. NPDC049149 TaxID=3364315 RepID=UPI00371BDC9E
MIEPTERSVSSTVPMAQELEFRAVRAAAGDTVHTPLAVPDFAAEVAEVGLGNPVCVRSVAADRSAYLREPDLGHWPDLGAEQQFSMLQPSGAEIGIVLADGLSPRALRGGGAAVLAALRDELGGRHRLAVPVIATQAGVALGDHIGQALGVTTVLVVIGERPGPAVADSLSIYLTKDPMPGRPNAERVRISGIRQQGGLDYVKAARIAADVVAGARQPGPAGVELDGALLWTPNSKSA